MSHAAAEACTQQLAAGRGDGYRLAPATTVRSPVHIERPSTGRLAASINYGCAYTPGTRHAIPPTPRRGNRSPATTLCRLQCVVAEVCAIFSECRLYLHERQG